MRLRSRMKLNPGVEAKIVNGFKPDRAFFDPTVAFPAPNRLPGDVKPSYKWNMHRQHTSPTEFCKPLAQLAFYMGQHGARYGFILTDRELVAVQRLDENGAVALSEPIAWTASGTQQEPRMTVLLGLWYLGMLASDNNGWGLGTPDY